ncbi:hypothetical protein ACQPYK_47885 [Streptosporangium sp. CA-135522]|uniref:hypothetical protein n=1 Tax=Streptosporangium sp. CA-135522 TaxID=3240072 RepID=UPI003D93514D
MITITGQKSTAQRGHTGSNVGLIHLVGGLPSQGINEMGTRPCMQRAARLTAGMLLVVQISSITLASPGLAAAAGNRETGLSDPYQRVVVMGTGSGTRPDQPIRLAHAQAAQQLRNAGLRWKSSGHCTDRQVRWCTSLEAIRTATVTDVIALKRQSDCPIVVTGGTEVGHAPGRYSHHRGYKLDIKPNHCINQYITHEHVFDSVRGDGAPLYRDSGTIYAREADHWDILFR